MAFDIFVESHVHTAAVVDLDEVEVPVDEVEFAVLLLVASEAHAKSPGMFACRAAGVVAGVAVDACLQAELMDIVHQRAHPVREQFGIQAQMSVLSATVPIAVVDVHIEIACLLQPVLVHGISLTLNEFLVDVEGECVPRTPAHRGCPLGKSDDCQAGKHRQKHCSTHSLGLFIG